MSEDWILCDPVQQLRFIRERIIQINWSDAYARDLQEIIERIEANGGLLKIEGCDDE